MLLLVRKLQMIPWRPYLEHGQSVFSYCSGLAQTSFGMDMYKNLLWEPSNPVQICPLLHFLHELATGCGDENCQSLIVNLNDGCSCCSGWTVESVGTRVFYLSPIVATWEYIAFVLFQRIIHIVKPYISAIRSASSFKRILRLDARCCRTMEDEHTPRTKQP